MGPYLDRVDHLVYATTDLSAAIDELSGILGVRATPGGRHPQWGTRNALISIGSRTYLEIMAPDPENTGLRRSWPFGLDSLKGARLATWASRADDLQSTVRQARSVGIDLGDIQEGSRQKPDGSLLTWAMTDLLMPREGGVIPFFIDWGRSKHPAEGAPALCALLGLRAEHPDPDRMQRALAALGLDLPVTSGREQALVASLSSPRGEVELR